MNARKLLVAAALLAAGALALYPLCRFATQPDPDALLHLEYLRSTQLPSGALAFDRSRTRVIPYFANYTGLALLRFASDRPAVRRYIEWYLVHLNLPDVYGLYGSIDDYAVFWGPDGRRYTEVPTNGYDSADSTGAVFLTLVRRYLQLTGDWDLYWREVERFDRVAELLLGLQATDGLTFVGKNLPIKYLMDNCETYQGLSDWAWVQQAAGHPARAERFAQAATRLQQALLSWPRRGRQGEYPLLAWAVDDQGKAFPADPRRWYPDAVAQLYPILAGLWPPGGGEATAAYQAFNQWFPQWDQLHKPDPHPWVMIALAGRMMGDEERWYNFRAAVRAQYPSLERPWYSLESSMYLLTITSIPRRILLPAPLPPATSSVRGTQPRGPGLIPRWGVAVIRQYLAPPRPADEVKETPGGRRDFPLGHQAEGQLPGVRPPRDLLRAGLHPV